MRLNSKGFTLIELLAVIVILAIIMVVTIPTVLSSMDNARKQTFQNSANTVADWVEKQYALAQLDIGDETISSAFTDLCQAGTGNNVVNKNLTSAGITISGVSTVHYGAGSGYCSKNNGYRSYAMIAAKNEFSVTSTTENKSFKYWDDHFDSGNPSFKSTYTDTSKTNYDLAKANISRVVKFLRAAVPNVFQ